MPPQGLRPARAARPATRRRPPSPLPAPSQTTQSSPTGQVRPRSSCRCSSIVPTVGTTVYCLDALVVTWKASVSQTWISPRAVSSTSRPAMSTAAARRGRRSPGSTLPSKAMLSRFDRAFRSTKRHRLQLLPWRGRRRVELGHRLGTAGERALRFQKRAAFGVWSLVALAGLRTLQQTTGAFPAPQF